MVSATPETHAAASLSTNIRTSQQLRGFKCPPSHGGLVEYFTATWVQVPSKSWWIGWMLCSYVGSSPLQVTLDWLNALQLCGFKSSPSHAGLVEYFTAMWVQDPSKSWWTGWMLYSYVGSSPLQVTLDWLNALQTYRFNSCWIGWMLYSYMGSSYLQVTVDWMNDLQLCGFKTPPSHAGFDEYFTAMWVQVSSKSWWIGWMLYSYMGSSPLQVMVDWLNALQLCGFKSPSSCAGLVECSTAMWVQVLFKSHWIDWMIYSYVGSNPLQVMLDWLNALQLHGFKSPSSYAGLVKCFTATWVQVPSKSYWIGWMLYSYMGSSPLQVTLDWLNALQLCEFKSPQSCSGLVECLTAMRVQVPSKSRSIDWILYSYVGSSPLQVTLDWLNVLQLRGFKCRPSHGGLVECFIATWVQVPSKSWWIGWMLYSYMGSSPIQVTLDWLNALQLCGIKSPPCHTGLVECFTAMWVQDLSNLCWIGWMLYSYVGSRPLQVMLVWLNALQTCGFKSCWNGWMLYSYVGSSPLQLTLNWLKALQLCGFKTPPSHAGLLECFTAMLVQVSCKWWWIGWMFYSYVGSSPLQVMLDWLNA